MAKIPGTPRRQHEIVVGLPVVQDDWDEQRKNQVALRNQCWVDGVCMECGAEVQLNPYPAFGVIAATFSHSTDCSVADLVDQDTPVVPMVVR